MKSGRILRGVGLACAAAAIAAGAAHAIQSIASNDAAMSRMVAVSYKFVANHVPRMVIGNLGGVSVSIPENYIFLPVEYEGVPFGMSSHDEPAPRRTFESKMTSLSMFLHMPDFKPRLPENQASYDSHFKIVGGAEWIFIGITAGSALTRNQKNWQDPFEGSIASLGKAGDIRYERQMDLIHGLTFEKPVWLRYGEDHHDNRNVYYRRVDGKVANLIRCGASRKEGRLCDHTFYLMPEMAAQARVQYADSLLPFWQTIEDRTRQIILGFRATSLSTNK